MNALAAVGRDSGMLDEFLLPFAEDFADLRNTEVGVNEAYRIWTEKVTGWTSRDEPRLSPAHCRRLLTTLAALNGKHTSVDAPVLSATLPTGQRAQAVQAPVSEQILFTFRQPSTGNFSLDDWQVQGAFDDFVDFTGTPAALKPFQRELLRLKNARQIVPFFRLAVESRCNILCVGPMGSGKTTFMKSLTKFIPPHERLGTIEDNRELVWPYHEHPNSFHLLYKREGEGGAGISANDALAATLRMKPDRVLVAEVRDGETGWGYIKSLGIGAGGGLSSLHANDPLDAFDQLTGLIKDCDTGRHLDAEYLRRRLFGTIDVVAHFEHYKLRGLYYDPEHKKQPVR